MRRLALLLLCGLASTASADRRLFTYTYEYSTELQGETSLQLWHTQSRTTWETDTSQALEHGLEIEHGLTDHWDAALRLVFEQINSGDPALPSTPYGFQRVQLDTRYRFADRGEWPVDVLLYGHGAKPFGQHIYDASAAAVLARDFDAATVAININGAVEFKPDPEPRFGYAAGITYELHPKLNLGAETYATISDGERAFAGGPVIALAPASNLWLTFTLGFGINDEAPALAGRLLLGIEL